PTTQRYTLSLHDALPISTLQQTLRQRLGAAAGDLLLLVADQQEVVCKSLGQLRVEIAGPAGLGSQDRRQYAIAWIVDFPSFFWEDRNSTRLNSSHDQISY